MKAKTKVVDTDAKHNPVIPAYLPDSVTVHSLLADLSDLYTSDDIIIALNALIQEAEMSNHFMSTRRRSLQIVTILFHDILSLHYSPNTASMMSRLFEREWAKTIQFTTTELLCSLDQLVHEYTISGVNTDPQDLKQSAIVRELRDRLIIVHLGRETMELSASLVA